MRRAETAHSLLEEMEDAHSLTVRKGVVVKVKQVHDGALLGAEWLSAETVAHAEEQALVNLRRRLYSRSTGSNLLLRRLSKGMSSAKLTLARRGSQATSR
eukprot:CAMPEP_0185177628 /NCGR_PEP_ID=MMETSP1139-20130426/29973_1 /TAXON_ID=298111 /ORGANISM="Pavlova sp., Strain CCMP459" /LENGTH=99 /DNA_ID=CAMNT_0027743423 /DNA_START=15 /DNA_END=311 /DNA_ORIENTATION=+